MNVKFKLVKKALSLLLISLSMTGIAQTQRGHVRTLSRPDRQSEPLANVTISISPAGNAVLSRQDGSFSFICSSTSYRFLRIQKNGYQLVDKGIIGRQIPFSALVTQEIVMVSQKDLETDKKRIEDKAYERAQAEYQKQMAEIKRQYEAKLITEKEAARAEMMVGNSYQKYIDMIEGMAERYALTDYEGISALNVQIQQYIENADLEKADSLINSKGDLEQRIQDVKSQQRLTETAEQAARKLRESLTSKENDL